LRYGLESDLLGLVRHNTAFLQQDILKDRKTRRLKRRSILANYRKIESMPSKQEEKSVELKRPEQVKTTITN
jgi:hypothetical protein